MSLILPTLLLLCGSFIGNVFAADKIIVCYYGTWATYRTGLGKFDVANVNPYLCTHVIYAFAGIDDEGTVISLDSYLDLEEGRDNFRQFNALKQQNPKLKTILAVGGWSEGSAKYSTMAATAESRQTFIKSALKMVLDYGFDGLDFDWEYPNKRDTTHGVADIDNFTQLTKELREEFDKHGLILSAAVGATRDIAETSYDIPAISKYLDYIHVMTYDMHVGSENETGYNAALYRSAQHTGATEDLYIVDASIQYWLQAGCPPEKILLGIPFYGHTFTLADASNSLVGAPSSGPGIAGPYTVTNGVIGYHEFCVILQNETGWEVRRDELAMVPYAVQDVNWVSYDDPVSIAEKVKYSKQLGLGGVMIWSIETDDFHGLCGETNVLLKTINRAYGRGDSTTEAPAAPTYGQTESEETVSSSTSTTTVGTSEQVSSETVSILTNSQQLSTLNHVTDNIQMPTSVTELCKEEGIKPNPEDCASFIICVARIDGKFETYLLECPKNLLWDPLSKTCNYPENVQCNVQKT